MPGTLTPGAGSRFGSAVTTRGAETKAINLGENSHAAQTSIPIQRTSKKTATDKKIRRDGSAMSLLACRALHRFHKGFIRFSTTHLVQQEFHRIHGIIGIEYF